MSTAVKLVLYIILVIATAVSGYLFFKNFGKLFEEKKPKVEATAEANGTASIDPTAVDPNADTNTIAADTNLVAAVTNSVADTNLTAQTTATATNETPETNAVASTLPASTAAAPAPPRSRIGFWTGSFLLSVIALGALIAWDFSTYMGGRALKVLYNDDGKSNTDPEYEEAEKIWANGQPLEAIRVMRDYLNQNPREVHVALRIAEIYEKDLNNHLAAALEYEEVLKKKLPDERWGWAAIHLCNLYFKLGQEVKGYALLQRVVKEYGQTQASEKARKRLKEVDPNLLAEAEPPEPEAAEAPKAEEPKSNLPPGFRPKK